MAKILIAVLALLLFASCGVNSTTTLGDGGVNLGTGTAFGNAWNANCDSCNFETNVDVTTTTTLGDMYFGEEFAYDIASLDVKISLELGEPSGLTGAGPEALYIYYDDLGDDID